MKRFGGVFLGIGALGSALACGPSFQAIYEGNARFEHCYALEENAQTGIHDKADCWRDWSEHYTYGQTRDRIHYATARYVALSQSANVPTDEAMMMAAPGMTPRQSTITAPAPTNAFAPPPKVLDEYPDASAGKVVRSSQLPPAPATSRSSGEADAGAPSAPRAPLPSSDCGDGCGKKFRECKGLCVDPPDPPLASGGKPDAGKDAPCTLCDKTYRVCMRACFK